MNQIMPHDEKKKQFTIMIEYLVSIDEHDMVTLWALGQCSSPLVSLGFAALYK